MQAQQNDQKAIKVTLVDNGYFCSVTQSILLKTNIIDVVKVFETDTLFLQNYHGIEFDLVVVNLENKDINGFGLIKELDSRNFNKPIIALTKYDFQDYIKPLESLKVSKCLAIDNAPLLASTIIEVLEQTSLFNAGIGNILSTDDVKLLLLICNEKNNEDMAEKLFISNETLKKRKQRLALKLHIDNYDKAFIHWAKNNGYF